MCHAKPVLGSIFLSTPTVAFSPRIVNEFLFVSLLWQIKIVHKLHLQNLTFSFLAVTHLCLLRGANFPPTHPQLTPAPPTTQPVCLTLPAFQATGRKQ